MAKRKLKGRPIHGILLLDKRQGVSSNKALQEVKRLYDANKAGHTGSLDPLATGLLPICFGEATKVSSYLLDSHKQYRAEIRLGVITDSGDVDGKVLEQRFVPKFDQPQIEACLQGFIGAGEQVPPMFSALKHNGKRLYELARQGLVVERKARLITIDEIVLQSFDGEALVIEVACSKGTYIRTLAEDIGEKLGCGATISGLRRLRVNQFEIEHARTLENLQSIENDAMLQQLLIPVDQVLGDWPSTVLDTNQAQAIVHGQTVDNIEGDCEGRVRIYSGSLFLGIGELLPAGKLVPKRLFNLTQH